MNTSKNKGLKLPLESTLTKKMGGWGPRFWISLLAAFLLLSAVAAHSEKIEQLSPQGYVNDFAGVLDAGSRDKLTALCAEVDQKAGAQIAIVTVHTLEGDSIEDFTNRLFGKWGVGQKGTDRGVMILLAVDDHQYRTEVGYGLEPILPDGRVGGFGRQMVPLLRQNQYGPALLQIASQVASVIARDRGVTLNQSAPSPPESPGGEEEPNPGGIPSQLLVLLIFLFFFGGWRLLAYFLAMAGLTRYRRGRGYRGGWWMGPMGGWGGGSWGSGGGGWSGGGFGGFGGGMSGGGGASGRW